MFLNYVPEITEELQGFILSQKGPMNRPGNGSVKFAEDKSSRMFQRL
jgi:hypothetical protein